MGQQTRMMPNLAIIKLPPCSPPLVVDYYEGSKSDSLQFNDVNEEYEAIKAMEYEI